MHRNDTEVSSLQPFMEKYLKIQDTCGVHNLHAMPGVLGGVVGAITAAAASEEVYGHEGYVSKTQTNHPVFQLKNCLHVSQQCEYSTE